MNSTINFMYFIHNFPYNFIELIFGDDIIYSHMNNKWDSIISNANDYGYICFMKFFMDIDREHQETIVKWVDENYRAF